MAFTPVTPYTSAEVPILLAINQNLIGIGQNATGDTTTSATLSGGSKTVASAGTPEKLTASSTLVQGVIVSTLRTNTGDAWIGFASGNDTQAINLPVALNAPTGTKLDLSLIYVDVAVNGEGVRYSTIN